MGAAGIYGQLVDDDGMTVGGEIAIRLGGVAPAEPSVAFDGTNFLVTWREGRYMVGGWGVMGQLVGEDGSLVGAMITVGRAGSQPAVAFGAGTYLVGWWEVVGTELYLWVRPVAIDGTLGVVSDVHYDDQYQLPADVEIATNGTDFFVVGHRSAYCWVPGGPSGTIGRTVGADGVPTSTTVQVSTAGGGGTCTTATQTTLTFGGTNYLVTTAPSLYTSDEGIYGQLVDAAGMLVGTTADTNFEVSSAIGRQTAPDAAIVGGNHFVVFGDERWPFPAIYAQRFDDDGVPVGATLLVNEPVFVAPADPGTPRVAGSATGGLVVFRLGADIHAVAVAP
jgi:hypothetical protein